jgi:beta-glucosidase-like glycosyl hydrolase
MRFGRHFYGGLVGTSLTDLERDLILKHQIGGFTLFARNIESAEQLRALNDEIISLADQAGYQIVLAVDQEGGRVERLPSPFAKIPCLEKWSKAYEDDPDLLKRLGQYQARQVKMAGFHLDFTPVVDVNSNPDNPIIGDRAFSSDPHEVGKRAGELIQGFRAEGVLTCLKHFPGHGDTSQDSHLVLPVDDRELDHLESCDLVPYQKLIPQDLVDSIMTAHVSYPKVDITYPATLSQGFVTNLLRERLQYEGVLFSDDFLMKAMRDHFDLFEAALRFFQLGGDAVLVCEEPELCLDFITRLEHVFKNESSSDNVIILEQALKLSEKRLVSFEKQAHDLEIPKFDLDQIKADTEWLESQVS